MRAAATPPLRARLRPGLTLAATAAVAVVLGACGGSDDAPAVAGADVSRGERLIERYGCGACHTISGVQGADAKIGPSLDGLRDRRYIAGELPNRPGNLARWIADPKSVDPRTLMPDLDVSPRQARDIAAYLYSDR